MGINVRRVNALAWGIAAIVATVGGVLLTFNQFGRLDNTLDTAALLAFPAIILGGIDSIPGAVVGGVVIGLSYELLAGYNTQLTPLVGKDFFEIGPYLLMIVVLLRPAVWAIRHEKGGARMSASSTASDSASAATATTISADTTASFSPAQLAPRLLGTRARWIGLGVGILVLLLFWAVADDTSLAIVNAILVYALATLSLNVLTGYTGQVSLGVFFFMGIGGFTAALLSAPPQTGPGAQVGLGLPFYVWLPAAGVVAAVAGAIIGPIALRLSGFYLAIVTLGLLYILAHVVHVLPAAVTGQYSGRSLGPITIGAFSFSSPDLSQPVLGVPITDEQAYFVLLILILAVCGLFVANVMRSRAGRAMQAVRDNETAAAIMGVNVFQAKMGAFILSSFLAGLAGALYAAYSVGGLSVEPPDVGLGLSIGVVAAILVGGVASVWGSILGAAVVFAIPLALTNLSLVSVDLNNGFIIGSIKYGIFGLFIMLFLLFEPAGVVGLFRRGRFRRPRFVGRLALRRRSKGGESAQTAP